MRAVSLVVILGCAMLALGQGYTQGPVTASYWDTYGSSTSVILAVNGQLIATDMNNYVRSVNPTTGATISQVNNTFAASIKNFQNDTAGNVYWTVDNTVLSESYIFIWNTTTSTVTRYNYTWNGNSSCNIVAPQIIGNWMFTALTYCSGSSSYLYGTNKQTGGSSWWEFQLTGASYTAPLAVLGTTLFTANSTHILGLAASTGMVTWNVSIGPLSISSVSSFWVYQSWLFAYGGNVNFYAFDTTNASDMGTLYTPTNTPSGPWFYTNSTGSYVFLAAYTRLNVFKLGMGGNPAFTWQEPNSNYVTVSGYISPILYLSASSVGYGFNADTMASTWVQQFPYTIAIRPIASSSILHISTPSTSYGYIWVLCAQSYRTLSYQYIYDSIRSVALLPVWNLTSFVVDSGSRTYAFGIYSAILGQTWNETLGSTQCSGSDYYGSVVVGDVVYSVAGATVSGVAKNGTIVLANTIFSTSTCLGYTSAVTYSKGKLILAISSGNVGVVSATTGLMLQTYTTSSSYIYGFVVDTVGDGSVYFIDSSGDKLSKIALGGTTLPTTLTTATISGAVSSSSNPAAIDASDTDSVFATTSTSLYCFKKSDLSACLAYGSTGKTIGSSLSAPVVFDGRVYATGVEFSTTYSLNVYSYGTTTGIRFQKTLIESTSYNSPGVQPFFFGGNLILFDSSYNLISCKPYEATLSTQLNFKTPTALSSSVQLQVTPYGGIFVFAQTYTVYAYNYTGGSVWNWTTPSLGGLTLGSIYNGVLTVSSGYYIYAIDVYKGAVLYTIYSYGSSVNTLNGVNDSIVFQRSETGSNVVDYNNFYGFTYYMSFYNSTTLPAFISNGAANGGGILAVLERNKLWIIGIVAAIVVLAVIVVIVNKNRGGTGQKDQDYVAMNNQGGRV